MALIDAGADAIKVGIGPGSIWGDLKNGAITYVKAPRPLILLCEPAAGA